MKLLELLIFINSVCGRREDGKPEVQGLKPLNHTIRQEKNLSKIFSGSCGGSLTAFEGTFGSMNFPNNHYPAEWLKFVFNQTKQKTIFKNL